MNNSRAWARQVLSLVESTAEDGPEVKAFQRRLVYRHLAFINALRVYLRSTDSFPLEVTEGEPGEADNHYDDCRRFLDAGDFERMWRADNPPDALLQMQGQDLRSRTRARLDWQYVLVQLDQTLVALNHVQGGSERVKETSSASIQLLHSRDRPRARHAVAVRVRGHGRLDDDSALIHRQLRVPGVST